MIHYIHQNKKTFMLSLLICLAYNLYFIFLIPNTNLGYLFYLDFLLFICFLIYIGIDYLHFHRIQKEKEKLLQFNDLIYHELTPFVNDDVAEHEVNVLQHQLQQQFDMNCDLQDYIAKCYHEIKIPLATCLLINENIDNKETQTLMKEQLEKINQQLHLTLTGCKIQSSLYDMSIHQVNLLQCMKTSIHNNQFFLIKNHFDLNIDIQETIVYSDEQWLVYIFDQIINNAIKYATHHPVLKIWCEKKEQITYLYIEDRGEGIQDSDLKHVFEKGFTGRNHHNGKYKSTGMGLYIVKMIIEKLGHDIEIESEYGKYTRLTIIFQDNRDFFLF